MEDTWPMHVPLECTMSPLLSLPFHTPPCTYSNINIVSLSASEQPSVYMLYMCQK